MRALSLLFVLLLRTAALAQAPDVYTNSADRFTLRTPEGWKVADEAVRAKLEQARLQCQWHVGGHIGGG